MSQLVTQATSFRLACSNFSAEEMEAVRRLLHLLTGNLRNPWVLVGAMESPNVVIQNLDVAAVDRNIHASVVGCAAKPKLHPSGTLYRPVRGYELLALLNREAPQPPEAARPVVVSPAEHQGAWRYRLKSWPLAASEWPRERWAVMAAIRRVYRGEAELAMRTGVSANEIRACIETLSKLDLLDREPERRAAPRADHAPVHNGWRGLAAKVGHMLGFAR